MISGISGVYCVDDAIKCGFFLLFIAEFSFLNGSLFLFSDVSDIFSHLILLH